MSEDHNAPTVKANRGELFYNPGDRFSEPINYSLDGYGDIHAVARWIVDAEAGTIFRVPTELRLAADGNRIAVDFPSTVLIRFKDRGVLMIDPDWQPGDDEDESDKIPFARDEAEAKKKGARLWAKYLQGVVRNHIEACHRAKAMGGVPLEAVGFTKRAFKLLNMIDPATLAFEELKQKSEGKSIAVSEDPRIGSIQAELDENRKILGRVLSQLEALQGVNVDEQIEARSTKKR